MKKVLSLAMAAAMVFALCACGAEKEAPVSSSESAGIANPVTECTQEELLEETGLDLAAPEGSENAAWSYIESADGTISQVQFTLDGNSFCYRAEPTAVTSLEGDGDTIDSIFENGIEIGAALSGMYCRWNSGGSTLFAERDAVYAFNEGEQGFLAWLDVAPGILYSLSMDQNCTQTLLEETAAQCFVPVQGESGR